MIQGRTLISGVIVCGLVSSTCVPRDVKDVLGCVSSTTAIEEVRRNVALSIEPRTVLNIDTFSSRVGGTSRCLCPDRQ